MATEAWKERRDALMAAEHRSNARESTREKHEAHQAKLGKARKTQKRESIFVLRIGSQRKNEPEPADK